MAHSVSKRGKSPAAKRMKRSPLLFGLTEPELESRLATIRKWVAKPIRASLLDPETQVFQDPHPALVENSSVFIGNKYHAADVEYLANNGVTAVLNCASGGISRLPVDELTERGIEYRFTNVRQDDINYPILHSPTDGVCSRHLEVAKELYAETINQGGKVLFFCVAGQNRSATLALAVLMLYGHSMDELLVSCSKQRPFVLENKGFQRQLVELEKLLTTTKMIDGVYTHGTVLPRSKTPRTRQEEEREKQLVEIELLIPGLCTMDVKIPVECTIATVKQCLVDHANRHLLRGEGKTVAKSWVVLAGFGHDTMYDFPLETDAIEPKVQLQRLKGMFGLEIVHLSADANSSPNNDETTSTPPKKTPQKGVRWTARCRFALVILSVYSDKEKKYQEPWTFEHTERPGAQATLLENNLISTYLRAWDFVTGQAFASKQPVVFSFAEDPRDRRQFMKISTSANEAQQFEFPGEGGILGMGANAIVHHVELEPTSPLAFSSKSQRDDDDDDDDEDDDTLAVSEALHPQSWDAAVKRPFGLSKMLASLESSSEAGLAKRVRFANSLNSDGRVIFFYGLGVALSANADRPTQYKFEATLLARYEPEFSTYTMRKFMEEYTSPKSTDAVTSWRNEFSLISVKVLLVSLLNAFRDLTLMGVQAFDFNHLNNVLVSRDHKTVKLLDIDGNSKGSIQFPSEYIQGRDCAIHKPALDVDLNTILPTVVYQLLLGKGRGTGFVVDKKSEIWKADKETAKELFKEVIRENFDMMEATADDDEYKTEKHLSKLAEWFYAMLKKQEPWGNWSKDIYDAMRCIDHLPIG
eukprot:scaffold2156_cov115-Cylindrotheca_fusiformis.AAC.19